MLRLADWASALRLDDVPPAVVEQAKNQVLSTLGAVHAGFASDLGPRLARTLESGAGGPARAIPAPAPRPPAEAAGLMAAWSMVLDFDDVMLGGHTGHSSVLVPLAFGHARGATGAELLGAQIVANEIAARINMTVAIGPVRGQMATHLHSMGAAAALARLEGLPAQAFAEALAMALAYPARALYPAFLGSDAKAFCAAWPIRTGIDAVRAVQAGLRGYTGLLDDPHGFIDTLAQVPVRRFLGGLGEQWHTATNSYKVHPACGYLSGAIEAALALVREEALDAASIERVDVFASVFTVGMDRHSAPYLAEAPLAALGFSTPYTLACALLDHDLRPDHYSERRRRDPTIWALARRIHVHHDLERTADALLCDIPLGAALRRAPRVMALAFLWGLGARSFARWLRRRHPLAVARLILRVLRAAGSDLPLDLEHAEKRLGATVVVRTAGGRELRRAARIPAGFAGSGDWRRQRDLMRGKYLACAAPRLGEARAEAACRAVEELETLDGPGLHRLVRLNCAGPGSDLAAA